MNVAEIKNGLVINYIIATVEQAQAFNPDATWVDITDFAGVGIGDSWDGTNFTPPPPGPATYRTLLSHQEWVNTWTATEWASLNAAASGTAEPPVSQSVSDTVAQLLASVSASNSIDVASAQADTDYSYLEANGFIDAARKAELQQGIEN